MNNTRSRTPVGCYLLVLLLLLGLAASLALNAGLLAGRSLAGLGASEEETAEDEFPSFTETWSWGDGEVKAVRVVLEGVLFREAPSGLFGAKIDPIESVLRQVRAAGNDEDVRALLVEVSSPGGDMTSADEIRRALEEFRHSAPDRRIVAFVRDMAASGGYFAILPADRIVSEPTALLGSLGVILQTLNWKGLGEKWGVTDTTIKSGEHKDLLNPFREVSPEQRAFLQEMVDNSYRQFFDAIVAARGLAPERLREVADGRIFGPDVALAYELIDRVGYWTDALDELRQVLEAEDVRLVRYEYEMTFSDWLVSLRLPARPTWMEAAGLAGGPDREPVSIARPMYLWRP